MQPGDISTDPESGEQSPSNRRSPYKPASGSKIVLRRQFDIVARGVDAIEHYDENAFITEQNTALHESLRTIRAAAAKQGHHNILLQIQDEELTELRNHFMAIPNTEADINTFVKFLSESLHMKGNPTKTQRAEMVEIFQAMDVDGSGTVSWPEFTAFVVNLFSAHQANLFSDLVPFSADRNATRVSCPSSDTRCGTSIRYFESWDRFTLVDIATPRTSYIRVLRPDVGLPVASTITLNSRVLVTEHIPSLGRLAIATNEGRLLFYDDSRLANSSSVPAFQASLKKTTKVASLPLCMKWDEETQRLFAGNRMGEIDGYRYNDESDLLPDITYHHTVHDGPIMDILVLSRHRTMVTASLDSTLKLSQIDRPQVMCVFGEHLPPEKRHNMGVVSLSHSPDYNMLVSVGNERNPFLWVPIAMRNPFVGKLVEEEAGQSERMPHRQALLGAQCIPGTPQVVSCDKAGLVKVWDLRKMQCVQSFTLQSKFSDFRCHSFVVRPKSSGITALGSSGSSDVRIFTYSAIPITGGKDTSATHENEIVAAVYNSLNITFLTAAGRTIKSWDANTGGLVLSFKEVIPSPDRISTLVLDDKCRRVLIGTHQGHVNVHSSATMVRVFEFSPHKGEVVHLHHLWVNKFFLSCSWQGIIHIYSDTEPPKATPLQVLTMPGSVSAISYNPFINLLNVGEQKGSVTAFLVQNTGKLLNRIVTHIWPPGLKPRLEVSPVFCSTRVLQSWEEDDEDVREEKAAELEPEELELQEEQVWYKRCNAATDRFVDQYLNPKVCEILAIVYAIPYPAYITSDTAPYLSVWSARPAEDPGPFQPLTQWKPYSALATYPSVTAMDWYSPQSLLVTGDDRGFVATFSLSAVLLHSKLQCGATFPRENGAEERFVCQAVVKMPDKNAPTSVMVKSFRVAEEPIVALHLVSTLHRGFVMATRSTVMLWTIDGIPFGTFRQSVRHVDIMQGIVPKPSDYLFEPPPPPYTVEELLNHREKSKHERNAEIAKSMRAVKAVNVMARLQPSGSKLSLLKSQSRMNLNNLLRSPSRRLLPTNLAMAQLPNAVFHNSERARKNWLRLRKLVPQIAALGRAVPPPSSRKKHHHHGEGEEEDELLLDDNFRENDNAFTPPNTPSRVIDMNPRQSASFSKSRFPPPPSRSGVPGILGPPPINGEVDPAVSPYPMTARDAPPGYQPSSVSKSKSGPTLPLITQPSPSVTPRSGAHSTRSPKSPAMMTHRFSARTSRRISHTLSIVASEPSSARQGVADDDDETEQDIVALILQDTAEELEIMIENESSVVCYDDEHRRASHAPTPLSHKENKPHVNFLGAPPSSSSSPPGKSYLFTRPPVSKFSEGVFNRRSAMMPEGLSADYLANHVCFVSPQLQAFRPHIINVPVRRQGGLHAKGPNIIRLPAQIPTTGLENLNASSTTSSRQNTTAYSSCDELDHADHQSMGGSRKSSPLRQPEFDLESDGEDDSDEEDNAKTRLRKMSQQSGDDPLLLSYGSLRALTKSIGGRQPPPPARDIVASGLNNLANRHGSWRKFDAPTIATNGISANEDAISEHDEELIVDPRRESVYDRCLISAGSSGLSSQKPAGVQVNLHPLYNRKRFPSVFSATYLANQRRGQARNGAAKRSRTMPVRTPPISSLTPFHHLGEPVGESALRELTPKGRGLREKPRDVFANSLDTSNFNANEQMWTEWALSSLQGSVDVVSETSQTPTTPSVYRDLKHSRGTPNRNLRHKL